MCTYDFPFHLSFLSFTCTDLVSFTVCTAVSVNVSATYVLSVSQLKYLIQSTGISVWLLFLCFASQERCPTRPGLLRYEQRSVPSISSPIGQPRPRVRSGDASIRHCLDRPPGCSASVAASTRMVPVGAVVVAAAAGLVAKVRPRMRSAVTTTSAAAPPNTPFLAT